MLSVEQLQRRNYFRFNLREPFEESCFPLTEEMKASEIVRAAKMGGGSDVNYVSISQAIEPFQAASLETFAIEERH